MPIIYCPYCDEEHDVLLLIKDISELYDKYLVTYVDTSYYVYCNLLYLRLLLILYRSYVCLKLRSKSFQFSPNY